MHALPEPSRMHALQYAFAAYLRDPSAGSTPAGVEPRRLRVYAELIYNNVESLLSSNFPVIRALYNQTGWQDLIRGFLRDHRANTPHFPEIGREFITFLGARHATDVGDPPFLPELAHYEWAELALAFDTAEINTVPHDANGDPVHGVPVTSPLAWIFTYRFPVHLIRTDFRPEAAPLDSPTVLLLVRNRVDAVRFVEINPLTQLLFERLKENTVASGLECLEALLSDVASPCTAELRETGITVLRDLHASEAILGTVPTC